MDRYISVRFRQLFVAMFMRYSDKSGSKKVGARTRSHLHGSICSEVFRSEYLSKTDTFGTGTKCPSQRGVRLIESQIKGVEKGRDQL